MQGKEVEDLRAAIAALESQRTTELTYAANCDRLIQAIPTFRHIVAAYKEQSAAPLHVRRLATLRRGLIRRAVRLAVSITLRSELTGSGGQAFKTHIFPSPWHPKMAPDALESVLGVG